MYPTAIKPLGSVPSPPAASPLELTATAASTRRHDLDWLRVLAFGLLILYHTGMYYVADWGWHIKSDQPSAVLQEVMLWSSPWRMSLLFFLSGTALFFACRKIRPGRLLGLRTRRLLLPLLFGMAVIVPPQVYIEIVTSAGVDPGFADFYAQYLDIHTDAYPEFQVSPLGLWTWNHLWFLAYLWLYTLVFLVCKPLLDRLAGRLAERTLGPLQIALLPILLLTLYRLMLAESYPPSNALFGDWYNHLRYLSFLFGGYLLAGSASFRELTIRYCWQWLALALLAYVALLGIARGELQQALSFAPDIAVNVLVRTLVSADQWLWIVAILGLGAVFLNRPGALLRYMNQAILPWYMLHQTLIVLLAFWLMRFALPQALEAMLILGGTVLGCLVGYELIRRYAISRLLFGLKLPR